MALCILRCSWFHKISIEDLELRFEIGNGTLDQCHLYHKVAAQSEETIWRKSDPGLGLGTIQGLY